MSYVWLNGNFVEESAGAISVRDSGFLHAAGVFTTLRSVRGVPLFLDRHLSRLRESCHSLSIPLVHDDEQLTKATRELLERNSLSDARLRITITRGVPADDSFTPTALITAAELTTHPQESYERGITVLLMDEQKLNPFDFQAGHKTLNYLSRLASLRSAATRSAGEALWFNVHNYLQSGSISNVLIVKAGKILTPPTPREIADPAIQERMPYPRSAVLPGITRAVVLELAKNIGIEVELSAISVNQLLDADEVFLTNSIMQVLPVCRIERSVIADDRPGPVTRKLAEVYRQEVELLLKP
ncbi:MAG: aminotransferase class IV [Phycisphaerales bacterium]|jgi:branched-subunit amino acid aminotransferase/4-amino-4-deoxychorismate lyase|nr:aminotransferase class IV [Phycisphaerales bacterium]